MLKKHRIRSKKLWVTSFALIVAIAVPFIAHAIQDIFVSSNQVVNVQIGNTPINKVYVGSELVWERYQPMQTFTRAQCASLPINKEILAKDMRDNRIYRVKKMPDNKCWMISNLAYNGGGTNTYGDVHTLTFANATATSPWTTTTGLTNRYVTTNNYTGTTTTDRDGFNNIRTTTATLETASGSQCKSGVTGTENMRSRCLSYLYSWCTAVGLDGSTTPTCAVAHEAGTGNGYASTGVIGKKGALGGESKGNSLAGNPAGVNSTTNGSICPAGWRLPVTRVGASDNSKNEYAILNGSLYAGTYNPIPDTTIGDGYYQNWIPSGSFAAVGSGIYTPGMGLRFQSVYGRYWSSSVYSSTTANFANVDTARILTAYHNSKFAGNAVRCVFN